MHIGNHSSISRVEDGSHRKVGRKCILNKRNSNYKPLERYRLSLFKGKKGTSPTTHLSEGPNSRTLSPPDAGKDVEQQGLPLITGGNASALENSLAVSYKAKHTLTIQSSNHTPWYSPK